MRVLYCTDTWPPQINGVSVVTAVSAAGLAERGWECQVIAPKYPPETRGVPVSDGVSGGVVSIPSTSLPLYPEARLAAPHLPAVLSAIRRFRPHLVHCATEFVIGRLGMWSGRLMGVPVVSSYHTDFSRYSSAYGIGWLAPVVQMTITRFHQQARRVYTPSDAARDDLSRMGLSDVEVWGRGVDLERFHPGRRCEQWRARHGLGAAFTFVYVGRLAPEKGVDTLLAAFAEAKAQLPDGSIRLVVVGGGPAEVGLKQMAPEGTVFTGPLDREGELPTAYASADAFAFASCTETLGLVVLEAMACGLPVVAAPAGGVGAHLRHGENGLAYPARDVSAMAAAMVQMATQPRAHAELRAGALRTASAMGWGRELDRLDASYREVITLATGAAQQDASLSEDVPAHPHVDAPCDLPGQIATA